MSGYLIDKPDDRDWLWDDGWPSPFSADNSMFMPNIATYQRDYKSCVGNAVTTACEYLYNIYNSKSVNLSRLYVYYYARKLGNLPLDQDNGAYIRDAIKAVNQYGICEEKYWPYKKKNLFIEPSQIAQEKSRLIFNTENLVYERLANLKQIRECIGVQRLPVVGGFRTPESYNSLRTKLTGKIKYPKHNEALPSSHAVCFIGYSDKTRLLKFQNSYSIFWGRWGYGYLPYEYVDAGLAGDFWAIN